MSTTTPHPTDVFAPLVVTCLTPMFLAITGGDLAQARAAAIAAVSAYTARHLADLMLIAQSIALGLAVLSNISLSMAENIPINLVLRLRGNAASLHRAAERAQTRLAEPAPAITPATDAEDETALLAQVTRTRQRVDAYQASLAAGSQPAPAAPQATQPAATANTEPPAITAQPAPTHHEAIHRAAWSAAMADIAQEIATGIATLPPAERRAAGIRAAALSSAASELIAT